MKKKILLSMIVATVLASVTGCNAGTGSAGNISSSGNQSSSLGNQFLLL